MPVLYLLVYRIGMRRKSWWGIKFNNPLKEHTLDGWYDRGVEHVFAHKTLYRLICILSLPVCVFFFNFIDKQRLPDIDQNELLMRIEWNENIHLEENNRRVNEIFRMVERAVTERSAYIGQQDYLLNRDRELSASEAKLYFKMTEASGIYPLQKRLFESIRSVFSLAVLTFSPPETVFEKLFVTGEADVVAELYVTNKGIEPQPEELRRLEERFTAVTGMVPAGVSFGSQINIRVDHRNLLLYNVSYDQLYRTLKSVFRENSVTTLQSYQQYLPVYVVGDEKTVDTVLAETLVPTLSGGYIQLRDLVRVSYSEDLKSIRAGRNGEYIPYSFYGVKKEKELIAALREEVRQTGT